MIDKFQKEKGINSEAFRIELGIESLLLNEVEFSKIDLSLKHNSSIELSDFYSDNQRSYNLFQDINRSQFESLIQLQIQDAMGFVDKILHDARLQASQINQVLLIGGTSRIPLLINEIHETFGRTKVIELPNADTVIAEGAAIISYYNWQPYLVQPIDIQLADQSHYTVFDSGTILKPDTAKKEVVFFCTDNREGEARLIITTNFDNREHQVKEIRFYRSLYGGLILKCQESRLRNRKFSKLRKPYPNLFISFNLLLIPSTAPLVVLWSK